MRNLSIEFNVHFELALIKSFHSLSLERHSSLKHDVEQDAKRPNVYK
jgi:hypothetical protein